MQTQQEPTKIGTSTFQHPAIQKLQRVAHLMRLASAGYALWMLWNILNWWMDADKVTRHFGSFIGRDLSAMGASQRLGALALDLIAWALLLVSVVQGWKFLGYLGQPARWSGAAARHISMCAWFAIACEGFAQLARPLQSFLLTAHLPVAEQVWKWRFQNVDLLAVLFCLALLMFAYVFAWTMEMAEENRSFV
ncbi:hypothetical protein [Rhodoferax lacus]|nr:hypothetical protein [Rhodoferax lacus]